MLQKIIYENLYEIFGTIQLNLLEKAIAAEISYRLKEPYSILKKMIRKSCNVQELTDILAFRVIVPTKDDCYKALDVVQNIFETNSEKFKDFIRRPKINGYQSLHSVIVGLLPERNIEIQIRSRQMHDRAELGEANHRKYKNEQEERIRNLFNSTLSTLSICRARRILAQFNWTIADLIAYEQEIQNIWQHYQADLLSQQQQFVDGEFEIY